MLKNLVLLICLNVPVLILAQAIDNAYKDFDFLSGEKILFEDLVNYSSPEDLKSRWNIEGGKATVVTENDGNCISLLEYYTKLSPRFNNLKALPDSFTIEYDTWLDKGYDGNPGIEIHLQNGEKEVLITPNKHALSVTCPNGVLESKDNPEEYFGENRFYDRWVHISIAFLHRQILVYLDQYKQINLADCQLKPNKIYVSGNTSENMKILLKNFKIATSIPEKFNITNGKFVTHSIRFDVNKAVIKPESISVLKQVSAFMKTNSEIKFEIGGFTDSDGDDAANLKLSEQRAKAVKDQLESMGIAPERLTSKGYGESAPVGDNKTIEGKSLNRRVEFKKI
ncbi:MAG: OmpA family protein [Bacteroidales bacterium]